MWLSLVLLRLLPLLLLDANADNGAVTCCCLAPPQALQRQRDKFVPLPFVASELGALDELPEGMESDSTGTMEAGC